jgi:hypothetical protein
MTPEAVGRWECIAARKRLIAAAPKLAAVARAVLDQEADGLDRWENIVALARAALAKAEGR